jgi:hypothetical protein
VELWLLLCGFCCCAIELSDAEICLLLLLFDRVEQCRDVFVVVLDRVQQCRDVVVVR